MQWRVTRLTITDTQIYLITFVVGMIAGVTFFQMKNDVIYPAMCLYQELRADKLRRSDIISASLLRYVAGERLREFGLLFLTQITVIRRAVAYIYCTVCGFSCAILEGFYVQEYGIKGLAVFFVTLMPHYIFYVMVWYRLCSTNLMTKQMNKDAALEIAKIFATAIVFLFVGIICESIFNVWIIKNFL